jgi:hypothetical protein
MQNNNMAAAWKKSFDLNNIQSHGPMRTYPSYYHRANMASDIAVLIYLKKTLKIS